MLELYRLGVPEEGSMLKPCEPKGVPRPKEKGLGIGTAPYENQSHKKISVLPLQKT